MTTPIFPHKDPREEIYIYIYKVLCLYQKVMQSVLDLIKKTVLLLVYFLCAYKFYILLSYGFMFYKQQQKTNP